ncbi:MAG: hypothetical protein A3D65_05065 [Candidatus Lloydbacteria bacterium RIFCSPHIGHO2_02_FULL_50_13]|uniref:Uncharacterized protein n=1 Tax=Candidatus Lloydbacteria bacterium RIFCSPHIGHO2_02_FULL_50_13 TaxID=1798661 RepID=A0A1G2D6S4_9BACT|nr:MAG: hypothetical protein A3D65_05065 [Candidatus Lloydbacteria bacterium RIFCSPHIGHO2_02_FULL_50_13]
MPAGEDLCEILLRRFSEARQDFSLEQPEEFALKFAEKNEGWLARAQSPKALVMKAALWVTSVPEEASGLSSSVFLLLSGLRTKEELERSRALEILGAGRAQRSYRMAQKLSPVELGLAVRLEEAE